MNFHFKTCDASCIVRRSLRNTQKKAFSLIEVLTALAILALVSSSVLVVINRCMASAADSALRMQAFEVARDNMETLLSRDSVKEMVEYGSSDKYPEIQWQTTVETFYEPVTERMWVRAICSAEYTDMTGDVQTIGLTHWLANLTKKQLLQIIEERKKQKERLAEEGEAKPEDEEPKPEDEESKPEDEEPKPEDEEPKPEDELRWCGKTLDEIIEMDFDDLWTWDCPEFWDWVSGGGM
jgi:prepilin-type N-terminal cleavage/methylation domain-containing protein